MKIELLIVAIAVVIFVVYKIFFGGKNMADQNTVKEKIQKGALIVDVRSPGEFAGGAYPKAVNIPVDQVQARIKEFGSDKSKPIVVYCLSGGRSSHAKAILESNGFTDVTNGGGYSNMPK
jgi:phage shock protein E